MPFLLEYPFLPVADSSRRDSNSLGRSDIPAEGFYSHPAARRPFAAAESPAGVPPAGRAPDTPPSSGQVAAPHPQGVARRGSPTVFPPPTSLPGQETGLRSGHLITAADWLDYERARMLERADG